MNARFRTLAPLRALFFTGLAVMAAGCVSYRYDLTAVDAAPATNPTDFAAAGVPTQVVKDRDLVIPANPARLRLRQVESRCVLMIENPTDAEITLDGNASAIVDPLGQSRYVATQLIPPGAFVKFVLPPLRDQPPTGPQFQLGIGMWASADADTPRPARYLQTGRPAEFWEWDGEGKIRIVLTLKQGDQTTRHTFVLTRVKE
ncbi:MAG: hypothetical protein QM754_10050 [Tepidisphaeraceae bacterium]